MSTLILASTSPRRKELLENLQIEFHVQKSEVDETYDPQLSPEDVVKELAFRKAQFVAQKNPTAYVIGSDTVVAINGEILGKPKSKEEATEMLRKLSGNIHTVYTGVAIISPKEKVTFCEKTDVKFWELTNEEIASYIQTGEPFDKAGGYGIQKFGSTLVKEIHGDYFSVVGLPVSRTVRELKKLGFSLPF